MELQSKVTNIQWPENTEYNYSLSGLGGSGTLSLLFCKTESENYVVHVKCEAKLSFLAAYHFEAQSTWEKNGEAFDFLSYEEKDFTKSIFKKWEMLVDGFNYIENKKGLVLEREIQYMNPSQNTSQVFDPLSAVTLALMESPSRQVNIFGKQSILQLQTTIENDRLQVKPLDGVSSTWTRILASAKIYLDSDNVISEAEIPSPIQIGKIRMKRESSQDLHPQSIKDKIFPAEAIR